MNKFPNLILGRIDFCSWSVSLIFFFFFFLVGDGGGGGGKIIYKLRKHKDRPNFSVQ